MIRIPSTVTPESRLDHANAVYRKHRVQLEAQSGILRTSVGFDGTEAWISCYCTAYASVAGELEGVPIRINRVPITGGAFVPPSGY